MPYEKVCPSVRSAQGSDFLGAETSPRIGTSGPRCLPDVDDNDDVDDDDSDNDDVNKSDDHV